MFKFLPAVVLTMAALAPLPALSETLKCTFPSAATQRGWISKDYGVEISKDRSTGYVSDRVAFALTGKPVAAQVVTDSNAKMVLSWEFRTKDDKGQLLRAKFRLSYFKTKGKANVSMTPLGYSNNFNATGPCTVK